MLRRNRATAPIVTFGGVTRPENVAMLKLLEIDLEVIRPEDLPRFERVALLDVQPNVLQRARSTHPDVVIDHHPEQKGYTARFRDIRSSYGATSTILTEYCLAAEVVIPQRLATALLYGIKSDTLFLDRETSKADILAFAYLYPHVNTNLLRRIEKPELPRSAFRAFARALREVDLTHGLAYVHLGAVEREDVIPQMAELSLQLEGAEWSAASGLVGDNLVVSVRNAGYQKAAGTVVKTLFGDVGSAGGHQAMAKAVIPLKAFRKKYGSTRSGRIKAVMIKGFLEEIECVAASSSPSAARPLPRCLRGRALASRRRRCGGELLRRAVDRHRRLALSGRGRAQHGAALPPRPGHARAGARPCRASRRPRRRPASPPPATGDTRRPAAGGSPSPASPRAPPSSRSPIPRVRATSRS